MKKAKLLIIFALVLILTLGGCAPAVEENPALTPEAENTPDITPAVENTPYSIPTTSSFSIEDSKDSLDPEKVEGKAENNNNVPDAEKVIISSDGYSDKDWYDEVIEGLGQKNIESSAQEAGAAAEYRVVENIALMGYRYYALQVYKDGTGKLFYIEHQGEDFSNGKILSDESCSLNKDDIVKLLKVISGNNFWNIPTRNPEEELGLDGTTYFIEGYSGGNTHFIRMWEPDAKYGIYQIYQAFNTAYVNCM